MVTIFEIENIKCGGCVNSVLKQLNALPGVFGGKIDVTTGRVEIEHTDEVKEAQLVDLFRSMGYPRKGSVEQGSFEALKLGAISYASCVKRKVSR